MNLRRKKQIAAAVTAVLRYEAEATASAPFLPPPPPAVFVPPVWGMAGRQDLMAMRSLWQRRIAR